MSVTIQINDQELDATRGKTLFECADVVGVRVASSCRRAGICRECLVQVTHGQELLSPLTDAEKHLKDGFRLACQCKLEADEGQVRCHTLRRGRMRIVKSAEGTSRRAGADRFDPAVSKRDGIVYLDGDEIEPSDGPIHGIAIDIGTTTCVLNLVDLETGQTVASTAFENPQSFGGSDIMSRIVYERDNPGQILHHALLAYLSHAIRDLPCDPMSIYEMLIVGNTTMRDMFFGLDTWPIGQKPYRSVVEQSYRDGKRKTTSMQTIAEMIGLPINPMARVCSLPLIGSHVGADAAACLAAIDVAHADQTIVMMDMGTNTELIIGHKGKLMAASCPAGPAFEGGGLSCGMPALAGAIERVKIDQNGQFVIRTVDGRKPIGICGSGLVDLLSELRRTDRMATTGRLVGQSNGQIAVDPGGNVIFRESDASRLAQAKAANITALRIVMNAYHASYDEIDKFYLCGGFARHLDLDAAKRIGLIPDLPNEKFVQVGNAAAEGATLALRSVTLRRELEELVQQIEHVELESDPNFFEHFVDGCMFEPAK